MRPVVPGWRFGDQVAAFQGAADPGPAALQELRCRLKHLRIGPFGQFLQPGPGNGVGWHGRGQSKNLQGAGESVFQITERLIEDHRQQLLTMLNPCLAVVVQHGVTGGQVLGTQMIQVVADRVLRVGG